MIFLINESDQPKKKSSKNTPHELGVKEGKEVYKMSWRQRQKEEYSFYVTGVVVAISLLIVIGAVVKQIFFK